MDLEQTVKDLQSQNAQFQQLLMTLAKGQEDLKTLLGNKDQVKKKKKRVGVATLGRRFAGEARRVLEFPLLLRREPVKGMWLQYLPSLIWKKRRLKRTKTTRINNTLPPMISIKVWKKGWQLWSCREFQAWISKIWD